MAGSAKQRQLVEQLLQEVYGQVDHIPTRLLGRLAPVLAQAQKEIEKDLRAWLGREDGEARFTTQRLRASLVQVRRSMERISRGVNGTLMDGLRIGSNYAGHLATAHVTHELERFGAIFGRGDMLNPASFDIAAVMASGERLLVNRFQASVRAYSEATRAQVAAQLAVSKIRGETVAEATTRLQQALPGVFSSARWRAERLVRTELMGAYNVQHELSVRELRKDDPDIRMRWDAFFDRRTCPQCASLDGSVIDPEGRAKFHSEWTTPAASGPRRHPTTRLHKHTHERPPAHPNCRCVLVAWRADWQADITRDVAPSTDVGKRSPATSRARAPEPAAARPLPRTKLPAGWSDKGSIANAGHTEGWPVVKGMPSWEQLDWQAKSFRDRLYVIPVDELERAGLYANPGAVGDTKMAPLARARAAGVELPPVFIEVDEQGRIFIQEGRHRLVTVLEEGKNGPVVARVERRSVPATNNGDRDAVRLLRRDGRVVERRAIEDTRRRPRATGEERLTPNMRDYLDRTERSGPRGEFSGGNEPSRKALAERGLITFVPDTTSRDPNARAAVITEKGRSVLAALRAK